MIPVFKKRFAPIRQTATKQTVLNENNKHIWRHFLIRQDKLKEGKAPVYARITVNTERILIGLKQRIDPR